MVSRSLLCCLLIPTASCHAIFGYEDHAPERGQINDGPGSLDARLADAQQPPPRLSFVRLEVVEAIIELYSPAIRTDGKSLWANRRYATQNQCVTTRPDLDAPFGNWTEIDSSAGYGKDLHFFNDAKNEERVLVAQGQLGQRVLQLCNSAFSSCQALSILEGGSGQAVLEAYDVDGPGVGHWAGTLNMVFNVMTKQEDASQPIQNYSTDIWVATPTDPYRLEMDWEAWPLDGVNLLDVKEDDPTISPDGRILIYAKSTVEESASSLMVATRSTVSEPFSDAVALVDVKVGSSCLSPLLYQRPDGQLELYFHCSDNWKIYRALFDVN